MLSEPNIKNHNMMKLYGMPGHLIRRAQQVSTALFAEECGEFGLTSVQYAALAAIHENPDVDATRFRRTKSGVCLITQPMIDRLSR